MQRWTNRSFFDVQVGCRIADERIELAAYLHGLRTYSCSQEQKLQSPLRAGAALKGKRACACECVYVWTVQFHLWCTFPPSESHHLLMSRKARNAQGECHQAPTLEQRLMARTLRSKAKPEVCGQASRGPSPSTENDLQHGAQFNSRPAIDVPGSVSCTQPVSAGSVTVGSPTIGAAFNLGGVRITGAGATSTD